MKNCFKIALKLQKKKKSQKKFALKNCFKIPFFLFSDFSFDFFLLQKGLKNVFDEAILAALEPPEQPKKRKCCIL